MSPLTALALAAAGLACNAATLAVVVILLVAHQGQTFDAIHGDGL